MFSWIFFGITHIPTNVLHNFHIYNLPKNMILTTILPKNPQICCNNFSTNLVPSEDPIQSPGVAWDASQIFYNSVIFFWKFLVYLGVKPWKKDWTTLKLGYFWIVNAHTIGPISSPNLLNPSGQVLNQQKSLMKQNISPHIAKLVERNQQSNRQTSPAIDAAHSLPSFCFADDLLMSWVYAGAILRWWVMNDQSAQWNK